jgi:hypothetical protein
MTVEFIQTVKFIQSMNSDTKWIQIINEISNKIDFTHSLSLRSLPLLKNIQEEYSQLSLRWSLAEHVSKYMSAKVGLKDGDQRKICCILPFPGLVPHSPTLPDMHDESAGYNQTPGMELNWDH